MPQKGDFCFNPGSTALAAIERLALAMWSDLVFDDVARGRLRRDGLQLDGVRLTGPCPYRFEQSDADTVCVRVSDNPSAGALIDLWQLHFSKGLRASSSLAERDS